VRALGAFAGAGFLTIQVSFAEYSLFYRALLQKRPVFLTVVNLQGHIVPAAASGVRLIG